MEQKESFIYNYSASEQKELQRIREKYINTKEKSNIEKIKELDKQTTKRATIYSLILGIISSLILGIGMSCTMIWTSLFVLGIFIGLIGIAGMIFSYPVYNYFVKIDKEKVKDQILKLCNEEII